MGLNKKTLALTVALVAGFVVAGSVQAQSLYAGVSYTQYNFEGSGSVAAIKPTAATFKLGYAISPNFAVEGRVAASMSSDSVMVSGTNVDGKVDSHYGIFAKGILPLNDMFSAYGLIGFNDLSLKASGGSASYTTSKNGSSYGLGLDMSVGKSVTLNAEWARHFSDVTSVNFGVAYKF